MARCLEFFGLDPSDSEDEDEKLPPCAFVGEEENGDGLKGLKASTYHPRRPLFNEFTRNRTRLLWQQRLQCLLLPGLFICFVLVGYSFVERIEGTHLAALQTAPYYQPLGMPIKGAKIAEALLRDAANEAPVLPTPKVALKVGICEMHPSGPDAMRAP